MKTNIHQFREEQKQKFEKWRETGHNITYEQWLEIKLAVEIENHADMIDMIEVYRQRLTEIERCLYTMMLNLHRRPRGREVSDGD